MTHFNNIKRIYIFFQQNLQERIYVNNKNAFFKLIFFCQKYGWLVLVMSEKSLKRVMRTIQSYAFRHALFCFSICNVICNLTFLKKQKTQFAQCYYIAIFPGERLCRKAAIQHQYILIFSTNHKRVFNFDKIFLLIFFYEIHINICRKKLYYKIISFEYDNLFALDC